MDFPVDGSIIDDTAAHVSYFPADAWRTNTRATHYNHTYHLTNVPGAYMTFRFNGSFVTYCSNLADDHGDFVVFVDGRSLGTRSAYAKSLLPTRPLFTVSVEPGPHLLNISNAAAHTVMSLDYFITLSHNPSESSSSLSAPTGTGSQIATRSPSSGHPPSSGSQISKPVFHAVFGLLCGLVAVSTLGALLFAARRCARTRRAQQRVIDSTGPPCTPDPPPYPASTVTV